MPNDYVNKANISGTEYDIRDARIPATTSEDADKYLHVNAGTGALEFAEVQGGGSDGHLVFFNLDLTGNQQVTTVGDLVDALGIESGKSVEMLCDLKINYRPFPSATFFGNKTYHIYLYGMNAGGIIIIMKDVFGYRTEYETWTIHMPSQEDLNSSLYDYLNSHREVERLVSPLPFDASSKTYVLKAINGTLTWVEETA